MAESALAGVTVAVPETRELELFCRMLEERGARTLRCPLVAILDAPDPAPVADWIERFITTPLDDVIFLTGEGVRRLTEQAERMERREPFIARLQQTRRIARGPKPARALAALGLGVDIPAAEPTTDGVIAALKEEALAGRRVGVQLYGQDPNPRLLDFLTGAGARPDPVAPYVYASAADDAEVEGLIEALLEGTVDVIAFTSQPQVDRLFQVAQGMRQEDGLRAALGRMLVAAVGPVVAERLAKRGVTADLMPERRYFLKPLVRAIEAHLAGDGTAAREDAGS